MLSLTSADILQTERLAAALSRQCTAGDCVALTGDLGAGKTSFARGFIQARAGRQEEVLSPTFTLAQQYQAGNDTIWHFDLYRLEQPEALAEIGIDDALMHGISLIEWPQLALPILPRHTLHVHIATIGEGTERELCFSGLENHWKERLAQLVKEME